MVFRAPQRTTAVTFPMPTGFTLTIGRLSLAVMFCICALPPVTIAAQTNSNESTGDTESQASSTTSRSDADGQDSQSADVPAPKPYSPAVLAQAVEILDAHGLKPSGRQIICTSAGEISRALSGLPKQRRELRQIRQAWQQATLIENTIVEQLSRLNRQYGELNLRLASIPAISGRDHNKIVAMINATAAKTKQLAADRQNAKLNVDKQASQLHQAESDYAEVVMAIRADFDQLRDALAESLKDRKVSIALSVTHRNLNTPDELTADEILAPVLRRLEAEESEVFRETIELESEGNGLFVNVTVGGKTTKMVLDSGASIISLPAKTAAELDIKIPADAPAMRMELADGRVIGARGVTLPSVRVGQFEAENVRAAVLDASASFAQPLLGMSYLGRFKFEIDAAGRTLKMLRIQGD
ncbi:hypothetical protein V7x_16400 [Crateriforma conspicua]|uniref:Retroviral aspartyl protease n=2 Tax=Crateriforma conspicua TaxID=2527996 RepID=A0A5C6FYH7_9PLAN|nr:hypothetical protein V7x_16400 [Crateriforma conspicua]